MTFVAYQPDGLGAFLEVGTFTDLQTAIIATPSGGHVEQLTDTGSVTVYTRP